MKPIFSVRIEVGIRRNSALEEAFGKFAGFSSGDAEAQRLAGKAWLGKVLVVQGGDFGCHFLQVPGFSNIIDENKIPFEAPGIEQQL
jgi:hypothetical protein